MENMNFQKILSDFDDYILDKEYVQIKEVNKNLKFVKTKNLDKIFF